MKHLSSIAAVFLLVPAMLVSCGKGQSAGDVSAPVPSQSDSGVAQSPVKPPEKLRSLDEVLSGLSGDVKDSNTFRNCAAQAVDSCEAMSVTEQAKAKSDIGLCDKMKSETNREACKNSLVEEEVRKSGDASACDKLTLGKQDCVKTAVTADAMSKQDATRCKALKPVNAGAIDDTVDQCVIQVVQMIAKSPADVSKCSLIASEAMRTACENYVRTKQYERR